MKRLFLIDGHALIFKMYYAFLGRPMVNGKGQDTSILFGFTKYLLEMIEREKPTHIAVSFDPPGGTFRNELYPEYKANRGETPQLVIDALEPLTSIVGALGIPVMMIKGFEADDVIGSAAKRFGAEGMDVYMVTPDKDYGQLVGPHVWQYKPGKAGSDAEILGPSEVCGKYGIDNTGQVVDMLALCGDSADNVPGVQGVGPVGASKLLREYGSVEGIYENLDKLSQRQRAMFEAASGHIALSKKLVTIKTDIPLEVTEDDLLLSETLGPEISELLDFYEMKSLRRFVADKVQCPCTHQEFHYEIASLREVAASAQTEKICAVMQDGNEMYVASRIGVAKGSPLEFKSLLEDSAVAKTGFDVKSIIRKLHSCGIGLEGKVLDLELMHYLLNPERSHSLDALAMEYLGVDTVESQAGMSQGSLFDDDGEAESEENGFRRCAVALALSSIVSDRLGDGKARELYDTVEEPLLRVLARMETAGVLVDLSKLRDFAAGLRKRMAESEEKVRGFAGNPSLNVSSPKQIGELIFEQLKLDPKAKKPLKGSWPTDEETLREIQHPVVDAVLDYRAARKLLSTYIDPFPEFVSRIDGRVHTTFNQALTSTGRLSSSSPNLQNIPVRTDDGREIRKAFTAPEGSVIMSADYSQIELRLMAHFCGDEHMRRAFLAGEDVHSSMAAKIFHKPLSEVTAADRRVAKTANFGIMYGISAYGLSQRLQCSRTEASRIIDDYFESFPSIREYIDGTLEFARSNGYVQTLFGRRRYVTDVNSHNANVRAVAERNAINAPIQGSAADIIKLAMIGVDAAIRKAGLKSKLVLQIHDELVLEVPEGEIGQIRDILVNEMEHVVELSVPMTVECNYGKDWLEAH
ncbi:MAG: DNA polymerase I [Bacteroidales bacterium]|nr:DNA polymerase I [Bacteroidales bacterium]